MSHNFGDKIKVKSFATGELVEVIYYSKEEALTGQFEQVYCIVPPESRSHFYNNKMINVLESGIVEEVLEIGDWVQFEMPFFTGDRAVKGQVVEIDENPKTQFPYKVRHVDGDNVYFYWCGWNNPAYPIIAKI